MELLILDLVVRDIKWGNITAYSSSDRRLKENIKIIESPLNKVTSINGVTFDWTKEFIEKNGGEDDYFMRKSDVGVIARNSRSYASCCHRKQMVI